MGTEYLDKLDAVTRKRGLSLSEWGANEIAWDRVSAQQVAITAADGGFVIYGGDVWRRHAGGRWRPAGDNWFSERRPGENVPSFVERSKRETLAYMGKYSDPEDGSIRYVLVCEPARP
jgi:hypothetical protein